MVVMIRRTDGIMSQIPYRGRIGFIVSMNDRRCGKEQWLIVTPVLGNVSKAICNIFNKPNWMLYQANEKKSN